jgi:hypothetical protein
MNQLTKKTGAALVAGVFLLSAAGCSSKEEYSDAADEIGSLALEDMDYGASITQLKPAYNDDVKIAIEYDNRYLTMEEAIKISDYVASLNDSDAELMEETFYKPFLDKIVENSGYSDTASYIANMHDNIRDSYLGYEFEFDYILTEDCLTEDDDDSETNFSSIDSTLDSLTGENLSDKVTSRKLVTFDIEYHYADTSEASGSHMLSTSTGTYSSLYIYTIDGEIYII